LFSDFWLYRHVDFQRDVRLQDQVIQGPASTSADTETSSERPFEPDTGPRPMRVQSLLAEAMARAQVSQTQDALPSSPDLSAGSDAVFDQDWWLKAATDGQLERVEVTWDRVVVGVLTYHPTRRGWVRKAVLPPYTRLMTPIIQAPGEKVSTAATNTVRILRDLYARMPPMDVYQTTVRSDPDLVLAYQLNDFELSHKITFLSPKDDRMADVMQRMDHKLRNIIKTASRFCHLERHLDLDRFRRMRASVSRVDFNDYAAFERIVTAVAARGTGTFLSAVSEDGSDLATVFLVWDTQRLYYLSATRLDTAQSSKAATWLFCESLAFAKSMGLAFDADGFATVASAKSLQRWGLPVSLNTNVGRAHLAYQVLKPIKDRIRRPPF
jgi:hypothetical protein